MPGHRLLTHYISSTDLSPWPLHLYFDFLSPHPSPWVTYAPFEGKHTAMDDGQITSQWNNFGILH